MFCRDPFVPRSRRIEFRQILGNGASPSKFRYVASGLLHLRLVRAIGRGVLGIRNLLGLLKRVGLPLTSTLRKRPLKTVMPLSRGRVGCPKTARISLVGLVQCSAAKAKNHAGAGDQTRINSETIEKRKPPKTGYRNLGKGQTTNHLGFATRGSPVRYRPLPPNIMGRTTFVCFAKRYEQPAGPGLRRSEMKTVVVDHLPARRSLFARG